MSHCYVKLFSKGKGVRSLKQSMHNRRSNFSYILKVMGWRKIQSVFLETLDQRQFLLVTQLLLLKGSVV